MAVPSDTFLTRFKSDGKTGAVFPITFGFTALSAVVVRAIPDESSPGGMSSETKVLDVDYTINPIFSSGTGIPIDDGHAESGWVIWIGASPVGVVEIYRKEETKQQQDLSQDISEINTELLERSLDRATMSLTSYIKRNKDSAETYDGDGRVIGELGNPKRADDMATREVVDAMANSTESLIVPSYSSEPSGKFVAPSTLLPSVPEIEWQTINELPTNAGTVRNALVSDGTSGAYGWESSNWIPEAPNDGLFNCLYNDGDGNMLWRQVYEVPLDVDGETDDVCTKVTDHTLGWREIPNELPTLPLHDTKDYSTQLQFYHYNTTTETASTLKGPKITTGTETFTVTVPEYTSAPYHSGSATVGDPQHSPIQFTIEHNMTDENGSDVQPAYIFMTITNPLYPSATETASPFWIVRINDSDAGGNDVNYSPGITSTEFSGQIQYLNVNDDLLLAGNSSCYFGSGITNYNLPLTDYTLSLNWMAMAPTDIGVT